LIFLFTFLLTACGTFEIGIEQVIEQESTSEASSTPPVEPSAEINEPTPTPYNEDELAIRGALAARLGVPAEELQFSINQNTGTHAMGNVSNGYFIAVKDQGTWTILYDGQGTPYCQDIESFQVPIDMVPECLGMNNQLIVRSGGETSGIGEALIEYFGRPLAEIDYTIVQDNGAHILGAIENGYFLAAKAGDNWSIAYDGQGTPYCAQVDPHNFPADMVPECLDASNNLIVRGENADDITSNLQSLDCGPGSLGATPGTVEAVACNIQDGLRSRNISALLGYMEDPFIIGYWLSEGVFYTPQDFLNLLPQLYNFNDPDYTPRLTFSTDRSQFPELDGRPLEGRFGPEVNVVEVIYSQGWGAEGDQESLIYLSQDSAGNFKWHGMLTGDLDIPAPSP
jgi:hypothetical protein